MNLLNMLLMCAGLGGTTATTDAAADGTAQQGSSWYIIVIYVVIFAAFIYFIMIRPSRKQKKQQEETMGSIQAGDSVLTTSGFYGTVVAVNGDTVIVEFGNNKNCRIPMAKQAISQVEKAGSAGAATSTEAAPVKKFFGRKKAEETPEVADSSSAAAESAGSGDQGSSSDGSSQESSSGDAE